MCLTRIGTTCGNFSMKIFVHQCTVMQRIHGMLIVPWPKLTVYNWKWCGFYLLLLAVLPKRWPQGLPSPFNGWKIIDGNRNCDAITPSTINEWTTAELAANQWNLIAIGWPLCIPTFHELFHVIFHKTFPAKAISAHTRKKDVASVLNVNCQWYISMVAVKGPQFIMVSW